MWAEKKEATLTQKNWCFLCVFLTPGKGGHIDTLYPSTQKHQLERLDKVSEHV